MWPPCLYFLVDKGHFLSPNSAILKLVWVFWLIESEVVNNTGIGLRWTWLNCCYRYKEFLWAWVRPAIIWVVSFASCAVWCEENDLNQFSWKCKEFPLLYFTLTDFITKISNVLIVFTFSLEKTAVKQHLWICSRLIYPVLVLGF